MDFLLLSFFHGTGSQITIFIRMHLAEQYGVHCKQYEKIQ
jgi:hypothetical protein